MNAMNLPPQCKDCGYELTGMKIGGSCPECGSTILHLRPKPLGGRLATLSMCLGAAALGSYVVFCSGISFDYGIELYVLIQLVSVIGLACAFVSKRRTVRTTVGLPDLSNARWGFWLNTLALMPFLVMLGMEICAALLSLLRKFGVI